MARGDRCLVADLSFDLGRGDLLWVSGVNGSGKSTLLRALAGLHPVADGRVTRDLSNLQFVGHKPGFRLNSRIKDEVNFWELDTKSGYLDDDILGSGKRVLELSRGQQQRLALARLCIKPGMVWVLDEPFTSLDALAAEKLQCDLAELCRRGGAAVVASHDIKKIGLKTERLLSLEAT